MEDTCDCGPGTFTVEVEPVSEAELGFIEFQEFNKALLDHLIQGCGIAKSFFEDSP